MPTVGSSNGPEIEAKREPEIPSTSCQHLAYPQQSHRFDAIATQYDRENTLTPQCHLTGSWKIHNQVQVCLTPCSFNCGQDPKRLHQRESEPQRLQFCEQIMLTPETSLVLLLNFSFPRFSPQIFLSKNTFIYLAHNY